MSLTARKLLVRVIAPVMMVAALAASARTASAQQPEAAGQAAAAAPSEAAGGGEANLTLPDLSTVEFLGVNGRTLLMGGLVVAALGLVFGLVAFTQLKNMPVHASMREVSELIYETCKTYLTTQGKFILLLWLFIAMIIGAYYGWLNPIPGKPVPLTLAIILTFSLIGIAGSYGRSEERRVGKECRL